MRTFRFESLWLLSYTCTGYLSLPQRSGKIRDISKCDFDFFGLTEHEANFMDVQMRLALETTYEAIVDAGIDPASMKGSKTGIFAGICYDDTGTAYAVDEMTAQHYMRLSLQRLVSSFDFKGGASAADTACASSFTAFYQAFYSLRAGLCDQAVVIGAAVNLRPTIALGFNNLRMTSQDGRSKCMDASGMIIFKSNYSTLLRISLCLFSFFSLSKLFLTSCLKRQTNLDYEFMRAGRLPLRIFLCNILIEASSLVSPFFMHETPLTFIKTVRFI